MAAQSFCLSLVCCLLALSTFSRPTSGSAVHVITSENFDDVSTGDWMLEFYAPWCPACKQFAKTWESFAEWTEDQQNGIRVAKVDVTAESALSGQFMVTHLPSIFHIHEGEVRGYRGKRSLSDLKSYVEGEEWKEVEPLPWWRSPTAKHMRVLGMTYWLSQRGKELQTILEEDYELPTYAVFVVIAVATILIGLLLGGIVVCSIEICFRCCSRKEATPPQKSPRKPEKCRPSPPPEEPVGGVSEASEHTDEPGEEGAVSVEPAVPVVTDSPNTETKKARKRKKKARQES